MSNYEPCVVRFTTIVLVCQLSGGERVKFAVCKLSLAISSPLL